MEGGSFDWNPLVRKNNFEAASVSLMKHAPGSETWENAVVVGMKLELRIHDMKICPKKSVTETLAQPPFWIVTIIKIQGYYALVRYEGMEDNSLKDFWIHMGLYDVHPIGGGETLNGILIPQKFVLGKTHDWRNYVINTLCGARTLPLNYLELLKDAAANSKYRVGDQLEVIDKYKISQLREARVSKIVGQRLYLQYACTDNDGFFCHENSSLIHAPGWASHIGHDILNNKNKGGPPTQSSTNTTGEVSTSTTTMFANGKELLLSIGMKLEAVDPLCPGRICAASICKVLEFGYMMIKIESYSNFLSIESISSAAATAEKGEGDDWFCYSIESPYIFKCGFCKEHGIPLVPPFGFRPDKFKWKTYLNTTGLIAAPIPTKTPIVNGFKAGMKVEMADLMTPIKVHVATIAQVAGRLLRITSEGWKDQANQWMDAESVDIYPIGYCAFVGHQLQSGQTRNRQKRVAKSLGRNEERQSSKSLKN